MTSPATALDDLRLNITLETRVRASLNDTFAALLDQLGPCNETPEGRSLSMKIEPWPGGRWYRDLGDNNGHFWAHVQAIKRPTLLEFCGPLFASYPLVSNLQYRLSEEDGGTLITFRHTALGFIKEDDRKGVVNGWTYMLESARVRAEGQRSSKK